MGSLAAALGLVFLAELGDKTQLVALGLGARHRIGPVMLGLTLGFAAVNLLSVIVGGLLGAALPTRAIGLGGGILFLGFAAWTLRSQDVDDADVPVLRRSRVVVAVAVAIFVAELGDKTMLTTATLAAQGNAAFVWIGATIGIVLSGTLGVVVGRMGGARLPARSIRIGSAALFAVFGVGLLVANA